MKTGDYLTCKIPHKNDHFYVNSSYEILRIFSISSDKNDIYYTIKSEEFINPFGKIQNSIVFDIDDINKQFYTKQELRKIKLEKLNQTR